jgi:SAM-dependent methyltransferase
MRLRESGMPDEETWHTFFDPAEALARLGLTRDCGDAVDFGCGYGTFTIAAARMVSGTVHALDVDEAMVERTRGRARADGLPNVHACVRDFMAEGTGLPDGCLDYAMVFNILHGEEPGVLLREAARVLSPGGQLGIMHWRHDPTTPRGPSLAIRPRPEQCRAWAQDAGLRPTGPEVIQIPPYHYGLVLRK